MKVITKTKAVVVFKDGQKKVVNNVSNATKISSLLAGEKASNTVLLEYSLGKNNSKVLVNNEEVTIKKTESIKQVIDDAVKIYNDEIVKDRKFEDIKEITFIVEE